MKVAAAIGLVFLGCCTNVIFLELLVKEDPGSGNLITFSQFLLISLEGFIFTSKFGTVKPRIGIKDYMILVFMFFVTSVCNNYAFDFNIPMPLHMIFRAGSLIANMIMGIIILKKKYVFSKYLSVFMITVGIIICTIVSGNEVKSTQKIIKDGVPPTQMEILFWWSLGIALLTLALFISARMGLYQEELYAKYGKHPYEALYYTHLLPLPFFLTLGSNIWDHTLLALKSDPILIPILGIYSPKTIVYLIGNVVTQFMCISSVFVLTTECSSLTVTLVVTLRKFFSLLFSVVYFQNSFSIYHWIGTGLVFLGTIIFTEIVPKIRQSIAGPKTKKVQ
ncbi:UDP-xylose and UDP-N-acetylglucosamine transporter [Microplitis demolitor]|uniref:UDP-xylose and UDP-N-acetylglucosamine transporter n=1 Tax=Microplitis demolitor TaxID=69319 RepID=UPI0004CD4CC0|nr:UDP-xylose and UDP-N-acetylglucosamine transporter [Microplitis demolitor]XP_008555238.1 UDP-xylose and UDP-N-acetylglucosamine transporter [Microplitis demolitor]